MKFGPYAFADDSLPIIAGPCVIESEAHVMKMAKLLAGASQRLGLQLIFKTSFDKANRTSATAFRGISLDEARVIFKRIKAEVGLPILTDVHTPNQPDQLSDVVDVIQIPAFLSRQTDLLTAAARTGVAVNVKKGQFLSPWEVVHIIDKLKEAGCRNLAVTERGSSFGYHNLVSDLRSIPIIQELGVPVIFDATHSAQLPGEQGDQTGGLRQYIPTVARAAVAAGCDGLFIEVHDQPEHALSDAATQWPFERFESLMHEVLAIRKAYLEVRNQD
ncbi:MAG: 3-deoxy-8-phosphooctulonate synthase [Fidelibacterota bacterium]|nr:MAG: 3-deoxy-8-phosphooctulonate synthase [Candidatus Neomarinimicrobiota bacterium]